MDEGVDPALADERPALGNSGDRASAVWLSLAFYRIFRLAKTLSLKPPDLGLHLMGIRPNLEVQCDDRFCDRVSEGGEPGKENLMGRMHRRKIDRHLLPKINYGLDTVRFPAPVPSGSRVRLAEASDVESGVQVKVDCVFQVEGQERPACVAGPVLRHHST